MMKKKYAICTIILLISGAIFIIGCSELKKTKALTFTPTYERQSLGCFTPFIHKEKTWQYSQLQFFISNVEVKNNHGQWQSIPLSENKYIDDCISKGYLHVLPSSKDHRKKVIIASDKMIKEMAEWLLEHSVTDT